MPINPLFPLIVSQYVSVWKTVKNNVPDIAYTITKNKLSINDLAFLIGPILNAGGRLGKSSYASELLSSDNLKIVNIKSNKLIKLNNKRKEIETSIINEIDFQKIEDENKDLIVYYDKNINEGFSIVKSFKLF